MRKSEVFETLVKIGAIEENRIIIISNKTRDAEVSVFKDTVSGVIFIKDYYIGVETYSSGDYRANHGVVHLEDFLNTERRASDLRQFYVGKNVLDVGYGRGSFLLKIDEFTHEAHGLDIDRNFDFRFESTKVNLLQDLDSKESYFDTIFLFHVLEHLPNPLEALTSYINSLKDGGHLILEIPHAGDFLIDKLTYKSYFEYMLWSQHLVLHTRESISKLLKYLGFKQLLIQGVQRYPLSNHYQWLAKNIPGGHKDLISILDNENLHREFESALAKIDATDSLLVIAQKIT